MREKWDTEKNKLFKDVKVASNGKHIVEAIYDNARFDSDGKKRETCSIRQAKLNRAIKIEFSFPLGE